MNACTYPLHPAQRDIYIDQVMNPSYMWYNQGSYLILKGSLNKDLFLSTIRKMLAANDVFRLQFDINELDAGVRLLPELTTVLCTERDFSKESEEIALNWIQDQLKKTILLKPGYYPHEHYLLKINDDTYWYFICYHHIILDGWGLSNWFKKIAECYRNLEANIHMVKKSPSYVSAMKMANDYYHSHAYEETKEYWKQKFKDPLPLLLEKKYIIQGEDISEIYTIELNPEQITCLISLQEHTGNGLSALSIAVLSIYFAQVTGKHQFTLGMTLHKRRSDEERSCVGMFSGILPFLCQYDPEKSFHELLAGIAESQKESYSHYRYLISDFKTLFPANEEKTVPLEIIVNHGQLDFALDFGNHIISDMKLVRNNQHIFPLEIFWREFDQKKALHVDFIYNKAYFSLEEIKLFTNRFLYILNQCQQNSEIKLKNITVIPPEEISLLKQYSNEMDNYESNDTIISVFTDQVNAYPDAIAVISEDKKLTYAELGKHSDALAFYLRERGIKPGTPIVLCMERTSELIIAILGILKAGAAYVPVEPDFPAERLQLLMTEIESEIVVTTSSYASMFNVSEIICWDILSLNSEDLPEITINSKDMAYIMFTSGSTGKPKGVMVNHHNVVSLIKARKYFPITTSDCILAGGSSAFDASTFEYWGALLNGGTLVMATKRELMDTEKLKSIIRRQGVTKMFFTTGWFNLLADTDVSVFETLTAILVGGERFSVAHAKKVSAHCTHLQILNCYGPTENTTFSLSYLTDNIALSEETPIGSPLEYRSAYILNSNQKQVPIGITGELYLGGAGLSNGYYKQPELTDNAFITHLFKNETGEKLYKTGDLVRWLPDGNIIFVGRADDQVKIRGFRVEPGEIIAILLQSTMVRQAIVIAMPDPSGSLQLVAYVTASENNYQKETLLRWLEMQLPGYMIPAHIILLETLPLNSNGKIDRSALPAPEEIMSKQREAPRNITEKRLAEIWKDLLKVSNVDIRDNFFHLGGHSLMAMRVSASIKKEWGLQVAPTVLFNCKTIERLAAHIDQLQEKNPVDSITLPEEHYKGKLPLSFGQERLWFIDCLHGSVQYHIILVFKLVGVLDIPSLEKALNYIINRHEVLRTVIRQQDGEPYQQILEKNKWKADIYDKQTLDEQSIQFLIDELVTTPFDLSEEHMLRAHIIYTSPLEHLLVINIHHIAADGWSLSVLSKELDICYRAYLQDKEPVLAVLPLQYKDYSLWQRQQESVWTSKLDYWQRKLNGVSLLNVPTDYVRSARQSVRGDSMKFRVDKLLTEQLKSFSVKEDVTLYMTLLAAFKVLLHRYCSQDDICVGGAISGRLQQEFEPLIGFFVNTLALRTDLSGEPDFREALQRVKDTLLEAYDHQEVPFERVVKQVLGERDTSRNPLFQVVFVLQNAPDMQMNTLHKVTVEQKGHHYRTSQFDLHFSVYETQDGLFANVAYCNDLFKASTIERLLGHFERILHAVVTSPDLPIGKMPMLSTSETEELLYSFSGVSATYPTQQTIVSLFTEQVIRTPGHIAVNFEGTHLSYSELDEQSTRLAIKLRLEGVEKGSLVPICTGHCLEMMVGILGILKAGGVYIPIDPEYPESRIDFILTDTNATIVLVLKSTLTGIQKRDNSKFICLDSDWAIPEDHIELPVCEPEQPAYIIYTSGSTGQPKGVIITHRNVVRLFMTSSPLYDFNEYDVWTMFHSYTFDFSVWEMYGALFYGGRLVIVPRTTARDTIAFTKLLEREEVTILNQTPSAFYVLQESILLNPLSLKVRNVIFGGEALHPIRLKGWHRLFPTCKLINMYGITETTVHVTYQEITEKEINGSGSVIGKPIPTLRAYILDKNLQPVPIGVPGELCIAGEGLAIGYLNREELTTERFVKHPFSKNEQEKLYRAGDLGKWLEDGNIEYLGRIDHQVKIRGYRIELGEIEHALNKLPAVMESCVVIKNSEDQSDKKLVCYYVPELNMVKYLEKSLHQDQVDNWQTLYEDTYGKMQPDDETIEFDIIGWNDSFTGNAIPEVEMKEWLDDICRVILAQQPQSVLEIGCGTGMIYYQLASHINQYTGVDLSHHSIEQMHHHIKNHQDNFPPTQLRACAAHEVSPDEMEHTDTIILNSVIQYFPGEDYLTDIIANNIARLNGHGRIILGDVRDLRLLYDFKSRLCLDKIQEHAEIIEFRWLVDQEMMKEEELCFAPDYFYKLKEKFPDITHVDINWKTGDAINELTLYRFTVILHIGIHKQLLQPEWTDWNLIRTDPEKWIDTSPPIMAISNMPNYRLWKERQLAAKLSEKTTMNVRELLYAIDQPSEEIKIISALLKKASAKGYHINMIPATDAMNVHVLLEKNPTVDFIDTPYEISNYSAYSNTPLFPDIMIIIQKQIREALSKTIPEYMIPTDMIALQHMPVTSNGKTNRGFLSKIEDHQKKRNIGYEVPVSAMEILLADIWQELLGIERVGALDNFFEIGGDSIRVVKVASRIKNRTNIEVSVADIYGARTIRDLATLLENTDHHHNNDEVCTGVAKELLEIEQKYWPLLNQEHQLESVYPMSSIQSGMIYDSLRNPDSGIYHDQFLYPVKQQINKELFERALKLIVDKHEILRTSFYPDLHEAGLQVVSHSIPVVVEELNMHDKPFNIVQQYLEEYLAKERSVFFDIQKGPLWRSALLHWQEGTIFILQFHHAILDGWSVATFNTELFNLYLQLKENLTHEPLPKLNGQYRDFVKEEISRKKQASDHAFWQKEMESYHRLDIFTQKGLYENIVTGYDTRVLNHLKNQAKNHGFSLKGVFLGAFLYALSMLSYRRKITIGLVTNNRPIVEDGDKLLGCFLNTIPFVIDMPEAGTSLLSYFRAVEDKLKHLEIHDRTPLVEIARINGESSPHENPFFDVIFNFINFHIYDELEKDFVNVGLEKESLTGTSFGIANTFLDFSVSLTGNDLKTIISLTRALQSDKSPQDLQSYFGYVLNCFCYKAEQKLDKQLLLPQAEEKLLLKKFNNTKINFSQYATLSSGFDKIAKTFPHKVAVVTPEKEYTYQTLQKWVDRLGTVLIQEGVLPGTYVPLMADHTIDTVVSILAIMKAGAAYAPIDPKMPEHRIIMILNDIDAVVILGHLQPVFNFPSNIKFVLTTHLPDTLPDVRFPLFTSSSCAYVIYTSGSTGTPKGVPVKHKSVINLIEGCKTQFDFTKNERSLLFASFTFDASVEVMFLSLLSGSALVLPGSEDLYDPDLFCQFIEKQGITHLDLTPGFLQSLGSVKLASTLKRIVVGGEECQLVLASYWAQYVDFYNAYGPTEATVTATRYKYLDTDMKKVPIGKPVPNVSVYILDELQQLLPIGVAGEICISGEGIADGYLHRPEQTVQQFIPDRFNSAASTTLYKTGDIGRWLSDGNLEYLYRADSQVKIRGYRIEPSEIESVLLQHPGIKQAAVQVQTGTNNDKRLIGYVSALVDGLSIETVISYLQRQLPPYMIPAYIQILPQIPLTITGKVDRHALSFKTPVKSETHQLNLPANFIEALLAGIWSELLGINELSTDDDFFALGGHSLNTLQLLGRIREAGYEIQLREILSRTTIARQAAFLMSYPKKNIQLDAPTQNKHIRLLNSSHQNQKIFLLPGSNGNCDGYDELAIALAPFAKIYGIQMMGVFEGEKPICDMENIAKLQLSWIQKIQPTGPYLFIAHSFGGHVLFEMIKQLEQAGEKVEMAALLDTATTLPDLFSDADQMINFVINSLIKYGLLPAPEPVWEKALHIEITSQMSQNKIPDISELMKHRIATLSDSNGLVLRMIDLNITNMMLKYTVLGKVNAPLVVIKATENSISHENPSLGWENHSTSVYSAQVNGGHFTMLQKNFVEEITTIIKQFLSASKE